MALGLLALGLALGMYISYFLCRFHLRLVANANPVSGGIWALLVASIQRGYGQVVLSMVVSIRVHVVE